MKKNQLVAGLILLLSIIITKSYAQDINLNKANKAIATYHKITQIGTPTKEGVKAMEKNIIALKERFTLLKSSGVKEEVLNELTDEISSKESQLVTMQEQLLESQESTVEKYNKALAWKDKVENSSLNMNQATTEQVAEELGVEKKDLTLDNIDYILRTQDVSDGLREKLESLANQIKLEEQKQLTSELAKVNTGRWKVKEVKKAEEGVKELVIEDKLSIKDKMFWELDLDYQSKICN